MAKPSQVHIIYPSVVRGDTLELLPFGFTADGEVVEPSNMCSQLKNPHRMTVLDMGPLLQWDTTEGTIALPTIKTHPSWPLGIYRFDVKVTLPQGEVKTLLTGEFELTQDISRCLK